MLTILLTFIITVVITIIATHFLKEDTYTSQNRVRSAETEDYAPSEEEKKLQAARQYFWDNINSEMSLDPNNAIRMIKDQLLTVRDQDDEETDQLKELLVEALIEVERYQDAVKIIEFLLKKYPHRQDLLLKLAQTYAGSGIKSKAIEAYKKVLRVDEDNIFALKELADLYAEGEQTSVAIDTYNKLIPILTTKEDIRTIQNKLAILYAKLGKWQEAMEAYQNILDMFPNDFDTLKNLKDVYLQLDKEQEALDILRRISNSEHLSFEVLEELMTLLYKRKEYEEFVETTKHLLKFPEANIEDIQNIIAKVFLKTGKYQESIDLLKNILGQCPENWYLKLVLAQAHVELQQFDKAIELYKNLLDMVEPSRVQIIKSNLSTVYCKYGMALSAERKYVKAFENFQMALRYDSKNADVFYQISYCNFLIKNYSEAFTNIQKALLIEPQNEKFNFLLADIYAAQDNFADALRIYQEIWENDHKNKDALLLAGRLLEKQTYYEEATEYYNRLLELEPTNTEVLCSLAKCYTHLDREERDIDELYQKVLEIDPENIIAVEYFNKKENVELQ